MSHERYKNWLRLAVANEITTDDMRLLRQHLGECNSCRVEFQELRQMMTTLMERGVEEPSEDMLWEARRNLHAALEKEQPVSSILTRKTQSVASQFPHGSPHSTANWFAGWLTGFRIPLVGATAAAVGFFIGYLAFAGTPAPVAEQDPDVAYESGVIDQELGGPMIANVRFLNRDPKGGEIEIQYDLVRPIRLRANVEDDRMQRVLAYAVVNEDNAGTRLRAIDALDTHGKRVYDNDVKLALIRSVQSDPNAGVRQHSMKVLQGMPFDRDIKEASLYVLANDDNPGLRVAAIDLLSKARLEGHVPGQEIYDFMTTNLRSEDDAFLRARSTAFIEEVRDGE